MFGVALLSTAHWVTHILPLSETSTTILERSRQGVLLTESELQVPTVEDGR
jgi:hypothetical protein